MSCLEAINNCNNQTFFDQSSKRFKNKAVSQFIEEKNIEVF